ncbi:EF-P 5-aminopentanol modification-associated protein YfmF [Bacillus alkalicellulosilyticus]|uniref:EF-P 5-aminopentanol modification-associated protein YfmF n=1 Tax=Alkalihalobacterium alkalicellulosilyticum TaxID=1912214 RepID=UPI001FE9216E|nr:pitrilysin family protein [Bacillus alkalicellulosilyticus]
MNNLQEKTTTANGVAVHVVETNKYKTNTIVLMLKAPLEKDTVTKRAILPHILQSGTKTYPSRQQIRNFLDELYGATLSADVQKKGENHIISFRLEVANEKFIQDETPLFEQSIKMLSEIVLQPHTEGGTFPQSVFTNEKRSLKQRIQAVYDDKMRYANMRITEEMCKDEPFGISVYGEEEEVDGLTAEQIYSYYQELLTQDVIDLYVIGDVKEKDVQETVAKYFTLPQADRKREVNQPVQKEKVKEQTVLEEQDVKQGKLHIGYRTNTTFADKDYFALQVCNGLFGGFSHSKLFMNVREKESLAYYAASRYESHKGILMVMSGIEFSNFDKAVTIIKEQLEQMQKGEFTDQEIEQTKAMVKNQILETVDVPRALVEFLYHNVVSGYSRSVSDWLSEIDKVTKEDIIASAKKIELDTIYFLKGKEGA